MPSPHHYNRPMAIDPDLIAEMVRNALLSEIVEAKSAKASPQAEKRHFAIVEKSTALALLLATFWLGGKLLGLN